MAAIDADTPVNFKKRPSRKMYREAKLSRGKFAFLTTCFFVTTSPVFGELITVSFMLASLGIFFLSIRNYNRLAVNVIVLFILLILPMTIFDLVQSLDGGFVTLSFLAIPTFLLFGYALSQSLSEAKMLDVYEKIVLYLAVPSSIVYLVFFVFPDIAYSAAEYTFRERAHRTFIILNILMNPGPVMRNAGFASEPGFYQILINVALYARLKRIKRPDLVCVFYAVVVLSTLSTAGIVVTAFLLSTVLNLQYRILLVLVMLVFLGVVQEFVLEQYKIKVENDLVFDRRFAPSLNAFFFFLENPLGIGAVEYIHIYEQYDIGSWDSFSQVALRYGLPGIIGLAILFYNVLKNNPVLLCLLCLSFLTSPIWFYPVIAILYFPNRSDTLT